MKNFTMFSESTLIPKSVKHYTFDFVDKSNNSLKKEIIESNANMRTLNQAKKAASLMLANSLINDLSKINVTVSYIHI